MPALTVDPALTLGLVVTDLVRRTDVWQPHVRFTAAHRHYVRIAGTDTYEAWLLTFLPGQSTGWHDHDGSAGAFTVVAGTLRERVFTDRGVDERLLIPGHVRPFETDHIHDLGAVHEPTVSIHIAAPALHSLTRYDVRAGALTIRSHESAVEDW
jgi:quercetin dioxygenase-like cupin family protein